MIVLGSRLCIHVVPYLHDGQFYTDILLARILIKRVQLSDYLLLVDAPKNAIALADVSQFVPSRADNNQLSPLRIANTGRMIRYVGRYVTSDKA
jgi:hypothetical protein